MRSFHAPLFLLLGNVLTAQNGLPPAVYDAIKAASVPADRPQSAPVMVGERGGGIPVSCNCWIEPDSTWTLIDNMTAWNAFGWNSADDGSYGPIALPFEVGFYGDDYQAAFVNINGNVSFGEYFGTFTSTGFPMSEYPMVAPFWADVDLGGLGDAVNEVRYKVTATALYVSWSNVGYYHEQTDKLNSFQLTITDGSDPVVPAGNNVAFCYRDMQWTTGNASMGSLGFGGTPATVGANRGNGTAFMQVGRFNAPGGEWDGAFDDPDGVDWLDGRHFAFSTMDEDIPPFFSTAECDTTTIEVGMSYHYLVVVHPGGVDQTLSALSECSTLGDFSYTTTEMGGAVLVTASFTPTSDELGLHTLHFEASAGTGVVPTTTGIVKVLPSTVGLPAIDSPAALTLAPNPAHDRVRIGWPDATPLAVRVLDNQGRLVRSLRPVGSGGDLELAGLGAGLYTVEALMADGTLRSKLVITGR